MQALTSALTSLADKLAHLPQSEQLNISASSQFPLVADEVILGGMVALHEELLYSEISLFIMVLLKA